MALALALALAGGLAVSPFPGRAQSSNALEPREVREVRAPFHAQEPAIPASLHETYRRLAAYWQDHNARAIANLAGGGRVYVVVQRTGVGERLAASQLQYVLQELFDEGEEVDFRFPAYTAYDPRAGTAYAVGERVWQDGRGPEARIDRIFVGSRSDRGRWLLTEIRLTTDP